MSKKNKLQARIGGALSGPQSASLIAAGKRALETLEPQVRRALAEHRARLAALVAAGQIEPQDLYDLAHDVRGLAGTFGYSNLGLIADGVARYLSVCTEQRLTPNQDVMRLTAQALDQAFLKDDEGGKTLADLTAGALALIRAKTPSPSAVRAIDAA